MALSLKELKESVLAELSEIRNNQDLLKSDMQQLIQNQMKQSSSLEQFEKIQTKLDNQVHNISTTISSLPRTLSGKPVPASTTFTFPAPSVAQPLPETVLSHPYGSTGKATFCDQVPPTPNLAPPPKPTQSYSESPTLPTTRLATSKRHKVLFIADSIERKDVDVRHLEEATNTLIYKEKAYGAHYKRNYSYAVLQGSSTDITNLDTSSRHPASLEYLKQEVFIASQNMIVTARNIIVNNPQIEKVLILDRIPRFDLDSTDPTQLKPMLSQYGNEVLRSELQKCDVKEKISVGSHSLPNHWQQNLYGHPARRGYDGIHLNGPDGKNHYTRSVCNVLQRFLTKHSREFHDHVIPSLKTGIQSADETSAAPKSTLRSGSGSTKKPAKPDSVFIDIDSTVLSDDLQYSYPIPTYNPFSVLGN